MSAERRGKGDRQEAGFFSLHAHQERQFDEGFGVLGSRRPGSGVLGSRRVGLGTRVGLDGCRRGVRWGLRLGWRCGVRRRRGAVGDDVVIERT